MIFFTLVSQEALVKLSSVDLVIMSGEGMGLVGMPYIILSPMGDGNSLLIRIDTNMTS